ncbi:MAG: sigma-54-dependent Fis family transcriptional regulator [Deltaproteobacteria bacterium]|nr:sigma-54-dependent Fis family transcriptional regulator [Deltaproteobacteria bacterium]
MSGEHILVVDDDRHILEVLRLRLQANGYKISCTLRPEEALEWVTSRKPDLMIADLRMAGMDGLTLLREARTANPDLPVIILTAHGSIENAVEAVRQGAYGYVTKPYDDAQLLQELKNALERRRLMREVNRLESIVKERFDVGEIIGKAARMVAVFEQVERVAPTDATVFISGESGTGKELVAKAIHLASPRGKGPFVAVNMGALPETLLENELFGHVKGAFTGANREKEGLFAAAQGGTIFLDEIGDAPLPIQVKLLRVLQDRKFTRLGEVHEIETDARVITASNRDLRKMVKDGKFREDLFFRIHVVPIELPPLRDRKDDIPRLAFHFLKRFSEQVGREIRGFSTAALEALIAYDWPGNVRELENTIEHAVVMAKADEIQASEVTFISRSGAAGRGQSVAGAAGSVLTEAPSLPPYKQARESFEREYLEQLLRLTRGNVSAAARLAGKYRADLYGLLRKHGLDPGTFKGAGGEPTPAEDAAGDDEK